MDHGLIPVAAFDVIRGWMLLEMMAFTETEKNMVKASTQNKLDYHAVAQALRAQWADRTLQTRDTKPYNVNFGEVTEDWDWSMEDYGDDTWNDMQWQDQETPEEHTEHQDDTITKGLAVAEKEAETLFNEAQISLQQAREAVAAARKDRGYGDGVQQG